MRNHYLKSAAAEPSTSYPADAARFLQLLDPTANAFEFRTLDDNPTRDDQSLVRTFYGSLAQHAAKLQRLNDRGAGVFVIINETDGRGRKEENIVRIRAVFADLDGAPLEPVLASRLKPHIVNQTSPGKYHAFWLVVGLLLEDFSAVQKAISERFQSCPNVHDLPRIMRLPGFYHRKREPFLVRILQTHDAPPYLAINFERRHEPPHFSAPKEAATGVDILLAVAALELIPPAKEWHDRCYIGLAVWRATDGDDEGFQAWCRWLQRSGRFDLGAAQRQWRRYFRSPPSKVGLGTLIFLANMVDSNWRINLARNLQTNWRQS